MPFFRVEFSDGSVQVLQAHNKTSLRQALGNVTLTHVHRCKRCNKAPSEVQNTLCQPCWDFALEQGREVWKDVSMTEQELKDLVMSFFVD